MTRTIVSIVDPEPTREYRYDRPRTELAPSELEVLRGRVATLEVEMRQLVEERDRLAGALAEARVRLQEGGGEGLSTAASYLECSHCGDEAIEPDEDGLYRDGDGGKCQCCGYPGQVSCSGDEGDGAEWVESDDPGAHCDRDDCDDEACVASRARVELSLRMQEERR